MNQRQLAVASGVVVAVIVIVAILWYAVAAPRLVHTASQAPVTGKAQVGRPAPEFTVATTAGLFDLKTVRKPVFVEIFATWCPHCQRETAVIDKLYQKYKSKVAFVGVSGSATGMDGTSVASQADVLQWVQRFNVQYPVGYDPVPPNTPDGVPPIARLYLQDGFPTMVIVGKDKNVAYAASGEQSYETLDAALKKVAG
jgi:cytochrome c biogenesis protein CcmG/thiol:disulfide interchange protein DsbE